MRARRSPRRSRQPASSSTCAAMSRAFPFTSAIRPRTRCASRAPGMESTDMQLSGRAEAFDRWIRGAFVALNTELEELYFAQEDRTRIEGMGDALKTRLRD